jgi:hypothetical protein
MMAIPDDALGVNLHGKAGLFATFAMIGATGTTSFLVAVAG